MGSRLRQSHDAFRLKQDQPHPLVSFKRFWDFLPADENFIVSPIVLRSLEGSGCWQCARNQVPGLFITPMWYYPHSVLVECSTAGLPQYLTTGIYSATAPFLNPHQVWSCEMSAWINTLNYEHRAYHDAIMCEICVWKTYKLVRRQVSTVNNLAFCKSLTRRKGEVCAMYWNMPSKRCNRLMVTILYIQTKLPCWSLHNCFGFDEKLSQSPLL